VAQGVSFLEDTDGRYALLCSSAQVAAFLETIMSNVAEHSGVCISASLVADSGEHSVRCNGRGGHTGSGSHGPEHDRKWSVALLS
jgi:hypothetical protein